MNSEEQNKYYGLAIALMLGTNSGLWQDFNSLAEADRTAENLAKVIKHNLTQRTAGVVDGGIIELVEDQIPETVRKIVAQLNTQVIVANWETLAAASTHINQTMRALLKYNGGACPGFDEQPDIFWRMGELGLEIK